MTFKVKQKKSLPKISRIRLAKLPIPVIFIIVWFVAAFIFYLRFPNNFHYPNFFAEDGRDFVGNINDNGFIAALFSKFNGYFVFGLYLLTGLGYIINNLFFEGHFYQLPVALAIVSYAFLGLCCALPVLLLRKYLNLYYLITLTFLLALLPLPNYSYGTFGTIGNLKFLFSYTAVLLVMYRLTLKRADKRIILVDSALVVCVLTTAGAYFVLPFILLSDSFGIKRLVKERRFSALKPVFAKENVSLWSMIGLCTVGILQIISVAIEGVPKFDHYLNEPYQPAKTIELFIGRTFLYPIFTAAYDHLNDVVVVVIAIAIVFISVIFAKREYRVYYLLSAYMAFVCTLIFVANRTGVSTLLSHYKTSGPDNFFYAQNFIAVTGFTLLIYGVSSQFKNKLRYFFPATIGSILMAGSIYTNITNSPYTYMQYNVGTIGQQLKGKCSTNESDTSITFTVYPFDLIHMTGNRNLFCNADLTSYEPPIESFGTKLNSIKSLEITNLSNASFQTFKTHQDHLSGIAVYLMTYYSERLNGYKLNLYEQDCKTKLREVQVPKYVHDNSYTTIRFDPLNESKNKTFCFSITPDSTTGQKLNLGLSSDINYSDGILVLSGSPQPNDILFQVLYR